MKQWSMGRKLMLGIAALAALTVVSGYVGLHSAGNIQENVEDLSERVGKRVHLVGTLSEASAELYLDETAMVVNTFDRNRQGLEQWREAQKEDFKKIPETIATLDSMLVLEASKQAVQRIKDSLAAWSASMAKVSSLLDEGHPSEAEAYSKAHSRPAYDQIAKECNTLEANQEKLMKEAGENGKKDYAEARWMILGVILVSLSVGALILWIVRGIVGTLRNTVTELTNGGEQVAAASSQIASTSQSLSQGSSEQAASLEEVSASMEEMSAMTKRNAENSSEATAMMTETVSQVGRSNSALQEMVASMGAIKVSSEKVAKINKTIDEIAFQTNILALNAAVEAARAGEAGMGFAVVADEVRNLAQRSAVAAKDTAGLIEEAIANSNQGAAKLEQVATAIRAITDSASKVKGLVDEVNEASKQQTQGISQVATAVTQVSTVTQTAAASAEESAAAAEELSAQSQTVSELVKQLQGMVEGGSAQEHARPRMVASRPLAKLGQKPSKPAGKGSSSTSKEEPFPMETAGSGSFRNF